MKDLNSVFGPNIETWDEKEADRLEHLEGFVGPSNMSQGSGQMLTTVSGYTREGRALRRRRVGLQVGVTATPSRTSLLTAKTAGPASKKKK